MIDLVLYTVGPAVAAFYALFHIRRVNGLTKSLSLESSNDLYEYTTTDCKFVTQPCFDLIKYLKNPSVFANYKILVEQGNMVVIEIVTRGYLNCIFAPRFYAVWSIDSDNHDVTIEIRSIQPSEAVLRLMFLVFIYLIVDAWLDFGQVNFWVIVFSILLFLHVSRKVMWSQIRTVTEGIPLLETISEE